MLLKNSFSSAGRLKSRPRLHEAGKELPPSDVSACCISVDRSWARPSDRPRRRLYVQPSSSAWNSRLGATAHLASQSLQAPGHKNTGVRFQPWGPSLGPGPSGTDHWRPLDRTAHRRIDDLPSAPQPRSPGPIRRPAHGTQRAPGKSTVPGLASPNHNCRTRPVPWASRLRDQLGRRPPPSARRLTTSQTFFEHS